MTPTIVDETGEIRDDAFHVTAAAILDIIAADGFRVDRRGVLGTGAYFDRFLDTLAETGDNYDTVMRTFATDRLSALTDEELRARMEALGDEPAGGCDACRFSDPFSDRLCTIPDISAEDFDLGVSGLNCSRFQPRRRPKARETSEHFGPRAASGPAEQEAETG